MSSFNYVEPLRMVMIKNNCLFCGKYCRKGIFVDYIDLSNHFGYQYCKNCKLDAKLSKKKYCKLNKIILLTDIFEDYSKITENTYNIPRSNGEIEKWYIDSAAIKFSKEQNKWYVFMRNSDFSYYKNIYLDIFSELNTNNKNVEKIMEYVKNF